MKGLLTPLRYRRFGKAKRLMPWTQKYAVVDNLLYSTKVGSQIITVPKGFITNFATWLKPRGHYEIAALIHDYLYSAEGKIRHGMNRHQADRVFSEAMQRFGCSRSRINMMYYGVRLFGWWQYYKLRRKN